MKYFVDTNIFLRVLYKENENTFKECSDFFLKTKTNKINVFTSNLVLAEINWVLKSVYKVSKINRIKSLEYIRVLNGLKIMSAVDFKTALQLYNTTNAKFIGCLLASKINKDTIIVSYDKDFDKIKGVIRLTPGEVLKTLQK